MTVSVHVEVFLQSIFSFDLNFRLLMSFYLLSNNSMAQVQSVVRMSIKDAGYTESEVRDLVASNIGMFFPGLKTISTEFSRWEDSARRLDILAIDTDLNLHVMEFKRDTDGAHAELQALRYAAMLSVCDFNDLVQAGYQYRQKDNPNFQLDEWRSELLSFVGASEPNDLELPRIPKISLISSKFNKEITTTVLWMNEMFGSITQGVDGMDITCLEVGVYDLNGQRALHFDQIIPIPAAKEYQVRARAKDLESAKNQAKSKRARTVSLLVSAGRLKDGVKIFLNESKVTNLGPLDADEKVAVFTEDNRFIWQHDDQSFDSLNALTHALYNLHGVALGATQATQFWRVEGSAFTLAEEANSLAVPIGQTAQAS
jgi:hypothetical protein